MAVNTTIWHNPRCSKSRQALVYLRQKKINPIVRLYLQDPPTKSEIIDILSLLDLNAFNLTRTKEKEFKNLNATVKNNENLLIQALINCPKMIERPIIIRAEKAVIGRPITRIDDLF